MKNNSYRELMQDLYDRHTEFKDIWEKAPHSRNKAKEKEEVVKSRERFWEAFNRLQDQRLTPLRERFAESKAAAADEVIDFLETDIPAFRTGYEKEYYLRHLKAVSLGEPQKERLREIALRICRNDAFRRELRDWARLMIVLADDRLISALREIVETTPWPVHRKAKFMLEIILPNRRSENK